MWNLAEDKDLRYKFLNAFDRAMIRLDIDHRVLSASYQFVRTKHNEDKVLVFEKDNILFVFNWHSTHSYESYPIYSRHCTRANVLWSTDDFQFGGHGRVAHQAYSVTEVDKFCSQFLMYLPSRCAVIFETCCDEMPLS